MTERAAGREEREVRADVVAPDVGLPVRLDMRRALDIYVFGRNRTLGPTEKGSAIPGTAAAPFADPPAPGAMTPPPVSAAGVPVPGELRFDRNAGTWRDGRVSSKEEAPSG